MKKKILILLPKLTIGGTERAAVELANFLVSEKNIDVAIITMFHKDVLFKINNNVIIEKPKKGLREKVGRILYIIYLMIFLNKKIKEHKPDKILCLGYILFGILASYGSKADVFVSFRSSPNRVRFPKSKFLTKLYHILHYLVRHKVDGVIAQTEYAKEVFSKRYNSKIKVIPNYLREIRSYPLTTKKDIIINVGRLVPEKNQIDLLRAFQKLDNNKDWELHFLGDGPEKRSLKKEAKFLGIENYVVFHGFKKDVDSFLANAKILGFTSIIEGFPNAIIEAMANKVVPVSYDCIAGPSDIIDDSVNGYLVPINNVEIMAEKIEYLCKHAVILEELSNNAFIKSKEYRVDLIGDQYFNFLFN